MALNKSTAESLAEKLHDFNPNADVFVRPSDGAVVATFSNNKMTGEDVKAIGELAGKCMITFILSKSGQMRMVLVMAQISSHV